MGALALVTVPPALIAQRAFCTPPSLRSASDQPPAEPQPRETTRFSAPAVAMLALLTQASAVSCADSRPLKADTLTLPSVVLLTSLRAGLVSPVSSAGWLSAYAPATVPGRAFPDASASDVPAVSPSRQ